MRLAMPRDWWSAILVSLIIAAEQSPEAGEKSMTAYVDADKNFFSYLDLAYFHEFLAEPAKAAAACREAAAYDANTKWGHEKKLLETK